MDFYKLTDFQLYSIINSRHLDNGNKTQAEREMQRRNLSEEEIQKLADEFATRQNKTWLFMNLSPNILYLIGGIILIFLLRQCSIR